MFSSHRSNIEKRVVVSTSTRIKDELCARVEVIKRNVKNLLKIVKRDSWICDRQPKEHGKSVRFASFCMSIIDWVFFHVSRNLV